jgi:hypothetical protein
MDSLIDVKIYKLGKLHKLLKEKSLKIIDSNNLHLFIPDFNQFRSYLPEIEERLFSVSFGFELLEKYHNDIGMKEGHILIKHLTIEFNETLDYELKNIIKKNDVHLNLQINTIKKYKLNKLLKVLETKCSIEQLNNKPFPDFKSFVGSFKGYDDRIFSLNDGFKILNAYVNGKIFDFNKIEIKKIRLSKVESQNLKLTKLDERGLIGIQNSSTIRIKKSKRKYSSKSSVWTVKK